jgi:hypothetical protein
MVGGRRSEPRPRRRGRGTARVAVALGLVLLLQPVSGPALGEPPDEQGGAAEERAAEGQPLPRRPIAEAVEPAVERYLREHDPCFREAEEGIPCFPASVEARERVHSVAEALRNWKPDGSPEPGRGITTTPWGSAVAGVGFDPVCASKSALKALRGRNDTYYLYRVWDATGERAVLREKPLETGAYTMSLLGYELIDEIKGECQAMKAFSRARRQALERRSRGPEQ